MLDRYLKDAERRIQAEFDYLRQLLDEHEIHNRPVRLKVDKVEKALEELVKEMKRL